MIKRSKSDTIRTSTEREKRGRKMFRVPLLSFFKRVLTSQHQIIYFEDGRYILEWVPLFITEHGFRFKRGDQYLAFEVRLERNPGMSVSSHVLDIVSATKVLRSAVNKYHQPDKPFVAFPQLVDLLIHGMTGIELVITPIEDQVS